jgi:subtilisin family serine protease
MTRRLALVLGLLAVASLIVPAASAGEIAPALRAILDATDADQAVGAIVVMRDQVDLAALSATLDAEHASLAGRHRAVVRALMAMTQTQTPLRAALAADEAAKGAALRSFWITNAIALRAVPEVIEAVAARADVEVVTPDLPVAALDPVDGPTAAAEGSKGVEGGVQTINAPALWAMGIDGTGVVVSHIDSGADATHPALLNWRGYTPGIDPAWAWYDPIGHTATPRDFAGVGHGTHTMGTICGDDHAGNQIGVAPGATWISSGVIERGTIAHVIAAFQWIADPDENPDTADDVPAVVSNSWGVMPQPPTIESCDDFLWRTMDATEAAGVVVVFAAGNAGPLPGSVMIPADRATTNVNAFAVGALQPGGTGVALFSSRGPSPCDGVTLKPEVSAVGSMVRSSVPGAGYAMMSGTSMAAPHVAGCAALLRQGFPDTTADQVKQAMYFTAVDVGGAGEDNGAGMGSVDCLGAYTYLQGVCDADADGVPGAACGGADCNDADPAIHPGVAELCDGIDNNCDTVTDEGCEGPDDDAGDDDASSDDASSGGSECCGS